MQVVGVMQHQSSMWRLLLISPGFQAAVACANAGKQLVPDAIWQIAAMGTVMPSTVTHSGSSANGTAAGCNISNSSVRNTALAGATWVSGSNLSCISQFGVQDMIGNVWEWTDMMMQAGSQAGFTQGLMQSPGAVGSSSGNTWNLNGAAYTAGGWANGAPAAAFRGGSYADGMNAGILSLILYHAPSMSLVNLGFRCARPR